MAIPPSFKDLTSEQQVQSLEACLREILDQYDLGSYAAESINHEFNSTFKVNAADGTQYALRINVNSTRLPANLEAEVYWLSQIKSVVTPKPVATRDGRFTASGWHEATSRHLPAVLYTWLEGEEPGDEPSLEQLAAAGEAMAKLHLEATDLQLPNGAELPRIDDFLWGAPDFLLGPTSELGPGDKALISRAKDEITEVLAVLAEDSEVQPIHADLHPWNLMWHRGTIAVFDFDDSAIGMRVQDLAISLYYLDTDEQEAAFLEGYARVGELPMYSARQMDILKLQRRLILLNYLFETSNPDHIAMRPEYLLKTIEQLKSVLAA